MQVKSDFEVPYNIKQNVRVRKQNKFKDIKSRKREVVMPVRLLTQISKCALNLVTGTLDVSRYIFNMPILSFTS